MVTLIIGLRGDGKDLIPFHHLLICMASLAYLGMKLFPKCDHFGFLTLQKRDLVETMAITTGS
jgi:hypothetical protein